MEQIFILLHCPYMSHNGRQQFFFPSMLLVDYDNYIINYVTSYYHIINYDVIIIDCVINLISNISNLNA